MSEQSRIALKRLVQKDSDEGLRNTFASRQDVEVIHRDAFLNDYLNE
ncbi:MAG: hypothetical protein OXI16_05000 [Chloroflexota bacterium]|nr:hypothetical protein [Chloroflexota bacterium]